jgi:two-component system nitrogen regulation sensor histidine kinase NtrY
VGVAAAAIVVAAALGALPSARGHEFGILAALILALLMVWAAPGRRQRVLAELERGLERFSGADWSPVLDESGAGALGPLVRRFNALGVVLRERQRSAEQSEQLLHTLMDAAPMAILLLEDAGEIEYANLAARALFFEGRKLDRVNFLAMLGEAPAPFREAVLDVQDRLFTVELEGLTEAYHLAKRHFELHGKTHTLLMVKHLTRELRRQEIDVWKKLIRVLSHELNNSLAPITSLVHSARVMTQSGQTENLDRVFSTIEERAHHLQGFVESYARFARLPNPRRQPVNLVEFLGHIEALFPRVRIVLPPPLARAYFDGLQIEQVLINLLKNASEAGGPEELVTLEAETQKNGGARFIVADCGPGMSEEVLEHALLPFYSTKERGTGLGLALCREILEAHGGTIRLENRAEGGLRVTCELPGLEPPEVAAHAKLTLSRV